MFKKIPNEIVMLATSLLVDNYKIENFPTCDTYMQYAEACGHYFYPMYYRKDVENRSFLPDNIEFCYDLFSSPDFYQINEDCVEYFENRMRELRREMQDSQFFGEMSKYTVAKKTRERIDNLHEKFYGLFSVKNRLSEIIDELYKDGTIEAFNNGKMVYKQKSKSGDWVVACKNTVVELGKKGKNKEYNFSPYPKEIQKLKSQMYSTMKDKRNSCNIHITNLVSY